MAKIRDIKDYMPFIAHKGEKLDIQKVERLHRKVGDFRERFLQEKPLQDLLLNEGYELTEQQRPQSFLDVSDSTILRTQTIPHLIYLNRMIDLVTRPRIYAVSQPVILLPGQDPAPSMATSEGYGPEKLESLQQRWLAETEISEVVRRFQGELTQVMDEFNMKLILNRMSQARTHFFHAEPAWAEVRALQGEIEGAWDNNAHLALDSAYYTRGKALYHGLGKSWEQLQKSEFGRNFVLTKEELAEFFRRRSDS